MMTGIPEGSLTRAFATGARAPQRRHQTLSVNRAVIRAASAALKAADFLLAFRTGAADRRIETDEAA
jgi:hypothetical protein